MDASSSLCFVSNGDSNKRARQCQAQIRDEGFFWSYTEFSIFRGKRDVHRSLFFRDIIAVTTRKDGTCGFALHACPAVSSFFSTKRKQLSYSFQCSSEEEQSSWIDRLSAALYPFKYASKGVLRRLAILINPFGGGRTARAVFRDNLLPLLKLADLEHDITETSCAAFAVSWAQNLDLSRYTGVVCIGGDGLVYEVLNGFANRSDSETAMKTPVGVIPAGSHNALACSVGCASPLTAALAVIKGNVQPMDLMKVQLGDQIIYATSVVTWGLVSDIAMTASKWRSLGPQRYPLCGAAKFLRGGSAYRAKVSVLAHETYTHGTEDKKSKPVEVDLESQSFTSSGSHWQTFEGPFSIILACNHECRNSLDSGVTAPRAHISDGSIDLMLLPASGRCTLLEFITRMQMGGKHVNMNRVQYMKVKAFTIEPAESSLLDYDIDGELFPCAPVSVTMLEGHANIVRL
eukprot:GILK01008559.1.p1 GENE.GILK01008559.1~~GILK01008559.1.p1  ORF type:complete len:475 (-),score=57.67 GILK01008559.1:25-1404(-)